MPEQYERCFVDVGGWDTHVNEGGAQGGLATNLNNLGHGLRTFAETLGPDWKNTVFVTVSEFGRTFRENGNRGTDRGHGSVYQLLGDGLNGGRVAGAQVGVNPATLLQDRDSPVLSACRGMLAELFRRLWGLSPASIEQVFPSAEPRDLGLF
jgi:uncharacterized protein (DUF1501 family)